jgi:SDR family mycofactocin-dependent oxidoreductase
MGSLDGRVAFITGVARGQGRAHAVRLAGEGADILGIDICAQIDTVPYPLATAQDLEVTRELVERTGRAFVGLEADVREATQMDDVVGKGLEQLGHIDLVVANAGIGPTQLDNGRSAEIWHDVIEVNLTGTFNTVAAALPSMIARGAGGSIVLISSTGGLKGIPMNITAMRAYVASKHGVVGLMRVLANELASHNIRVNSVHPTGVRTPMGDNPRIAEVFAKNEAFMASNTLPVDMIEPEDVSEAVLWLASDAARYVTGITLPVDAGFTNRC